MPSKYTITARIYPAILCSIPILVLNYYLLQSYASDFFAAIELVKWTSGITLSAVLIYLLAQLGRFIGKEVFEHIYFKDELYMPTTEYSLYSDSTYSAESKDRLRAKVHSDFNISLPSQELETQNPASARRAIVEAVSMIRTKVKNGRLLLQHNIEYGFARNLIGGSVPALCISIFNITLFAYFFPNQIALVISTTTGLVYLALLLLSKVIINRYGARYAKILIQEYLSS